MSTLSHVLFTYNKLVDEFAHNTAVRQIVVMASMYQLTGESVRGILTRVPKSRDLSEPKRKFSEISEKSNSR